MQIMQKILSTTIIVTAVFYASISSAKPLPGLTNAQSDLLICATACLNAFKICTGEIMPFTKLTKFKGFNQLSKQNLQSLLGCHVKQYACYRNCNE